MTINPRMVFICTLCIVFSVFLGSYRSFQHSQQNQRNHQVSQLQQSSKAIGQNLEQKLMFMESAVSYLDQSTVETLKRLGARYFAYAFEKNGEWKVKWKVLGEMGKEAILQEVQPLAFSDYSSDHRQWIKTDRKELIYVTPVGLAQSHQLQSGFLIFGLNELFFDSIKSQTIKHSLITSSQMVIAGKIPAEIKKQDLKQKETRAAKPMVFHDSDQSLISAVYFPTAHLWITAQQASASIPFFQSSFFNDFLQLAGVGFLVLILLSFISLPQLSTLSLGALEGLMKSQQKDDEVTTTLNVPSFVSEPKEATVQNFKVFIDRLIAEESERLDKVGVQIKADILEVAIQCVPKNVESLLRRLIGNSVLNLESSKEKEIQIQLVEQSSSYQLIYVDGRESQFPMDQPWLADEDQELQDIDLIVADAHNMFQESLTLAKTGFCLSIDLAKVAEKNAVKTVAEVGDGVFLPTVLPQEDSRIEITDEDVDLNLLDDAIDQFEMKPFSFQEETSLKTEELVVEDMEEDTELETDAQGLVELSSGDFTLKIRSPKKRDADVNC